MTTNRRICAECTVFFRSAQARQVISRKNDRRRRLALGPGVEVVFLEDGACGGVRAVTLRSERGGLSADVGRCCGGAGGDVSLPVEIYFALAWGFHIHKRSAIGV